MVLWNQDLKDYGALSLQLGYDSISGASPTGAYPTTETTTSASGTTTTSGNFPQSSYTDQRKSVGFSWGRKFGANLPTINLNYAKENDYTAKGIGFSDAWTIAGGRATLHFGAAFSRDTVSPVKNPVSNPNGLDLNYPKNTNGFSLGGSWVFGERDLADLSFSLMNLSGYLDDPYKLVTIGAVDQNETLPDARPSTRSRKAIVGKYSHYFLWGASVNVLYRYYFDDWSVNANTLDVTYNQRIDSDWIVSPQIRLYTQTGAYFFANRFLVPQTYMSADYRLSPFGSVMGGLTVARNIYQGLSASVGVTYLTQHGRDRVTLVSTPSGGGGGEGEGGRVRTTSVSAADMNVATVTFGLTLLY
jgi:hypothetical protein